MRYARPTPGMRVLELGCGAGPNVPFFLGIESEYRGIEGSEAAVEALRLRFPALAPHVAHADFTTGLIFPGPFDVILDRSAVTHNDGAAIERVLRSAKGALRKGGLYVGIDWFSSRHAEAQNGIAGADGRTRSFDSGLFAGVGNVHFSDEAHMRELFAAFKLELLEEKSYERCEPQPAVTHATWNIVARNV